jgi:hypothetical protein
MGATAAVSAGRRPRLRANRKALLQARWKVALAVLGEFASPHADHGAVFGQTFSHRGDDLIGKRNLRRSPLAG